MTLVESFKTYKTILDGHKCTSMLQRFKIAHRNENNKYTRVFIRIYLRVDWDEQEVVKKTGQVLSVYIFVLLKNHKLRRMPSD